MVKTVWDYYGSMITKIPDVYSISCSIKCGDKTMNRDNYKAEPQEVLNLRGLLSGKPWKNAMRPISRFFLYLIAIPLIILNT